MRSAPRGLFALEIAKVGLGYRGVEPNEDGPLSTDRRSIMANKSWLLWGDRNRNVDFGRFKGQVDSLFEDWFGRTMGGVLAPRMDVAEDEEAVTLTAELPGVKENDIEVSLVGDQLTIKGEKRSEHDEKKEMGGRITARSGPMAPSSGRLRFPTASSRMRFRLSSEMAFSPSGCRNRLRRLNRSKDARSK